MAAVLGDLIYVIFKRTMEDGVGRLVSQRSCPSLFTILGKPVVAYQ
jgi:hypothetical protein